MRLIHLALALLFAAVFATSARAATDALTGTWVLDKDASESVDDLLKAQGVGFMERKVAAGLDVTQVIAVAGDTVTLEIQTTKKTQTQTLVVDGTARTVTGDAGEATVTHTWQGDALVTVSDAVDKAGAPVHTTVTRTVDDDGQVLRQRIELRTADGQTTAATRVFRRQ